MSKVDSETTIIVVSLVGETIAKQGRATHEFSHNAFCFVKILGILWPIKSIRYANP